MEDESTYESLKSVSKVDLLFPKLPLINESTGRRQDGRNAADVRPIFIQTGIRQGARGSSYVEMGSTKVICVISGPKDPPKKIEFSTSGVLSVEVQLVGGKVPERDICLIKECLDATVLLDKFPKLILEVYLTILEDGGSAMSACITAAGLALIEGGVPICDTLVGSTLLFNGEDRGFYLDPTKEETETMDLTDQHKNDHGGGIITIGYLPSRRQVCLFSLDGKIDPVDVDSALEHLIRCCYKVYAVVQKQSTDLLKELDNMDIESS